MRRTGEATCPHCQTTMTVELEECHKGCSPQAVLDTVPCHADDCTAKLCPNCLQFKCESCDLAHCEEHAIMVSGEKWCPICVQASMEEAVQELEGTR